MLAVRRLSRRFGQIASEIDSKLAALNKRLNAKFPVAENTVDPALRNYKGVEHQTMDEKLAQLDAKVANIEALREAGRPEEIRIKDLPNKYGRTGRFAAYPWYGKFVKPEDRIPHLADRLGTYGRTLPQETQLAEAFQFYSDFNKPRFDSPFVAPPSKEPDPDVNFEKGDVLYENPDYEAGVLLARQVGLTSFSYLGFYMLQAVLTGRATYPIGNELNDQRADSPTSASFFDHLFTVGEGWGDIMTISFVGFLGGLPTLFTWAYFELLNIVTQDFVVKMQFSADKSLLFVSRVRGSFFSSLEETVYETINLQVLPPSVRTGLEGLGEAKVMTLNCMNTKDSINVSLDKKYWSEEHRMEFLKLSHMMWSE
jgi:hypothetical protein